MRTKFKREGGRGPDRPAKALKEFPPKEGGFAAGVPLAEIISHKLANAPELVVRDNSGSFIAEKFRRLKSLLSVEDGLNPQVIVVTSSAPGEGKSLVAINLALAFGASKDERTLVIDADLRRPTLYRWLSPSPNIGLAELISEQIDPKHAILHIKDTRLDILPAGKATEDPDQLLGSNRMRELLEQFRGRYKKIIIDTPPIVPFTDADIIAACSDGVLLIARSAKTPISLMRQAESLVQGAPILGIVINDQKRTLADWEGRYESYYKDYYDRDKK
ncbi:MAG: CpsD/CapB family tyrosine-protein kinase [Acidobacteria bacterium]|uniref:non-specific protein-tyrosine kinase n=1 Tax=Candidatus Polarisedimenticola svalbardensis TaxID=2886004 RepID=A0A8J6Y5Z4_9BACT|nr:CpsD/CapB family tyrosine-protein kinase [Candidatus Polarisedimenticola svalbardensis]